MLRSKNKIPAYIYRNYEKFLDTSNCIEFTYLVDDVVEEFACEREEAEMWCCVATDRLIKEGYVNE